MILDTNPKIKKDNINYGRKEIITGKKEEKKEPKKSLLLSQEKRLLMSKFCFNEISFEVYNNFYERERLEKEIKKIHSKILEHYKDNKLSFTIRTIVYKKPFSFYSYSFSTGDEKFLEIQDESEDIYLNMKIFYSLKNIEKDSFIPLSKEIDNKRKEVISHSLIFLKKKNEIFDKIKEIITLNIKRFAHVQTKINVVSFKIIDLLEKYDKDYNFHIVLDFISREKKNMSFMIYDEKEFNEYTLNCFDYNLNITIYSSNKVK